MKKDHVKNAKSMTVAVKTLDGPMRNGRERICKWKAKTALSGGITMADCNKTAEFLREWKRLFDNSEIISLRNPETPKEVLAYKQIMSDLKHPEETIKYVQKWSDEHPVQTWESKLRELLPHADVEKFMRYLCPRDFFGKNAPVNCSEEDPCSGCWAEEYKEENNG